MNNQQFTCCFELRCSFTSVILKLDGIIESRLLASATCFDGDTEYISSFGLIKLSEAGQKKNNLRTNIIILFLM